MAEIKKQAENEKGFVADILPRVICVLLALFIWMYVVFNSTPDYEKSFDGILVTPINAMVLDDHNLTVYGDVKSTVEIVIYGARGDITGYSSEDIKATVDFIGITEAGEHNLPITIELPEGATVKNYSPKTVTVNVQEVTEKEVPLVAMPQYSTPYIKGDAVCTNTLGKTVEKVTVSGPLSELKLIDHVEARPSYDGMLTTSTTAVGVPLVACTKDGTEITSPYIGIVPQTVTVEIPIYDEKEVEVKVESDSAALKGDIKSITVSPSKMTVRKKIVRDVTLENVTSIVVATFNEENITGMEKSEELKLPVKLETDYENMSGFETVTATVTYRENSDTISSVMSFDCSNISIDNPDGKAFELLTRKLEVKVRVPKLTAISLSSTYNAFSDFWLVGSIDALKDGKIKLSLDAPSKYGEGIALVGEYYAEVKLVQ